MTIAISLLGFNDLGRSVILLSPHCTKMNVGKKIKISVHETWNPAILQLQGA